MASLELCNYGYRIVFRLDGGKYSRSLKTHDEKVAYAALGRLEENLDLVERGKIEIPENADTCTFLLTDGKRTRKSVANPKAISLSQLFQQYLGQLPDGAMEKNSLYTARIHMKHVEKVLGGKFPVREIDKQILQGYVNQRARQKGKRGKPISPTTIRKELGTLSSIWGFAGDVGYVKVPFPNRGLKFPKIVEKPPFQTWKEIEYQIKRNDFSETEIEELWDCLFLTLPEIKKLLAFVEEQARHPFLYPMLATAAYTGARRSELLRCRNSDFDFENKTIIVREKKRVKGKYSQRIVPMTKTLETVLQEWMGCHPGGTFTFCFELDISRTMKRRVAFEPLTVGESNYHFDRTMTGKWSKVRGWHIFRHSFISNCASKGVDQRMIDAWSGHQTEEMRRRYTHLFPDSQHEVIRSVFDR